MRSDSSGESPTEKCAGLAEVDDDDRIALALANDFLRVIQERVERNLQGDRRLREPIPVLHALTIVVANSIAMYARNKASREVALDVFIDAVRAQMPDAVLNVRENNKRRKHPH